jgi:hypothetical protein
MKACMFGYGFKQNQMLHGNIWAWLEYVQGLDLVKCALMMRILF